MIARLGVSAFEEEPPEVEGEALVDAIFELGKNRFSDKLASAVRPEMLDAVNRWLMLNSLDAQWKDHLYSMDKLKEGIGLRGYGQRDPLREYQREGFEMFEEMVGRIRAETLSMVNRVEVAADRSADDLAPKEERRLILSRGESDEESKPEPEKRGSPKVGRNDPCPCGSGRKHKHCCGR
jgi:preprotein translocase subunit SecA